MNPKDVLKTIKTILVIDWPSKEVPELLVLAGFHVVVQGGPGPEDYSVYELTNGKVVTRHLGCPPDRADLIYCYRPLTELPQIIATAKGLQAKTIWTQSGLSADSSKDAKGCWIPADQLQIARNLVESAGLNYITEPYIVDATQ